MARLWPARQHARENATFALNLSIFSDFLKTIHPVSQILPKFINFGNFFKTIHIILQETRDSS